jgi:hypothetical protein
MTIWLYQPMKTSGGWVVARIRYLNEGLTDVSYFRDGRGESAPIKRYLRHCDAEADSKMLNRTANV